MIIQSTFSYSLIYEIFDTQIDVSSLTNTSLIGSYDSEIYTFEARLFDINSDEPSDRTTEGRVINPIAPISLRVYQNNYSDVNVFIIRPVESYTLIGNVKFWVEGIPNINIFIHQSASWLGVPEIATITSGEPGQLALGQKETLFPFGERFDFTHDGTSRYLYLVVQPTFLQAAGIENFDIKFEFDFYE